MARADPALMSWPEEQQPVWAVAGEGMRTAGNCLSPLGETFVIFHFKESGAILVT